MLGFGPVSDEPVSSTPVFAQVVVVFRAPIHVKIPERRRFALGYVSDNLLLTVLAASAAVAPFVNPPQPNPVRPRVAQTLEQPPNLLLSTLAPVAQAPFAEYHWPLPPRARRALPVEPHQNLLLSTLQAAPAPFAQLDWPLPRPRVRPAQEPAPNLLLSTLASTAPVFPPGREWDFPNPVRRKWFPKVGYHLNAYDPVAPQLVLPFAQYDWPLPIRRNWMIGQTVVHVRFTERPDDALLIAPQRDWPQPVRRRQPQYPEQYPNLVLRYVVAGVPFAQLDWPLPVRARRAQEPPPPPNLVLQYVVAQPFPPGRQQDWPNPIRRPYRDWTISFSGTPLPNAIPPPVVPPDPGSSAAGGGGGGGGGGDWYKADRRRPTVYDRLRQDIREVVIDPKVIRDVYEELMASEVAAPEVAKTVRPPKTPSGEFDWDAMSRDAEQVRALMAQAKAEQLRREIAEDDADWEWF